MARTRQILFIQGGAAGVHDECLRVNKRTGEPAHRRTGHREHTNSKNEMFAPVIAVNSGSTADPVQPVLAFESKKTAPMVRWAGSIRPMFHRPDGTDHTGHTGRDGPLGRGGRMP
jgi:hypothetical protein